MKSFFSQIVSRKYFLFLFLFFVLGGTLLLSNGAFAQSENNFGLGKIGSLLPLGGEDIWTIVTKIIRIALSLLGTIAVVLMLYAGFLWMTSGGNEDKIAEAKKILINATIGLAIILSSLAITQFILSSLVQATGGTLGEDGPGGRGGAAICANLAECQANGGIHECGDDDFVVKSLTPKTPEDNGTGMSNVVVRAVFSRPLDAGQDLTDVLKIAVGNSIIPAKTVQIQGGRQIVEAIYEKATALCQGPKCLTEGNYTITVNPNLTAGGVTLKTRLTCGEFDNTANFSVNKDFLDSISPEVLSFTFNGSDAAQRPILPRGNAYRINATFQDRGQSPLNFPFGGISYLHLKVEGDSAVEGGDVLWNYFTGPRATSNDSFVFSQDLNLGVSSSIPSLYTLTFTAGDIDSHTVVATSSFILDGELCHNGRQDEGETGIDIGGECLGDGRCTADWQCMSGVCENGFCVNKPVISNVDVGGLDPDGWKSSPGSWVTVVGHYFGEEVGNVDFGYDADTDGTIEDNEWFPAPLAACNGLDMWKNSSIVVEVPNIPLAASTTVRVRTAAHGDVPRYDDTSTNSRGPKPGPNAGIFVINNETHPGLCAVVGSNNTSVATSTAPVRAFGRELGNGANSSLLFGGVVAKVQNGGWGDLSILSSVPQNIQTGMLGVKAKIGDTYTNGVQFTVISENSDSAPVVSIVTPSSTTRGSLITLVGTHFSESGTVFLAASREAAVACAAAEQPGVGCSILDLLSLPATCGNTWSDTQIIGKIPLEAAVGNIFLVVKNNIGYYSDGTSSVNVKLGDPRPGLCRLTPNFGAAPLAQNTLPLQLIGSNLTQETKLYYWTLGAQNENLATWLNSDILDPQGQEPIRSISADGTDIRTTLPASDVGISMISGPIRARVGNDLSNDINYTVEDCTKSLTSPGPDYQCCSEGDEAGSWKPAGYACLGQTKNAGYVWRFTTGFIPQVPRVVEACNIADWARLDIPNFVRPSPSPSKSWDVGDACINSVITVQFTLPMGADTIPANVRVYTCGQDQSPDCGYDAEQNVTANYVPQLLVGNRNVMELRFAANQTHAASTWHRVLLGENLHADADGGIDFDAAQRNLQKIASQKPLNDSFDDFPVAYYFDFKTDAQTCTLLGAGIVPPVYTARFLGMLQEPGAPFSANLDTPTHPYYYYVWGRGNQACSVIDVNGLGWRWNPNQENAADPRRLYAFATKSDTVNIPPASSSYARDTRATVMALQNTDITPIPITSQINSPVDGVLITGTSTLTIDLGDPTVVDQWPECNDSCINANIGVKFSRHMKTETYRIGNTSGIRIQKCLGLGENCEILDPPVLSIDTEDVNSTAADALVYEVTVTEPLALNQLYKVSVTDQIKSIGRLNPDGSTVAGKALIPMSWKFRTKVQDGICILEKVDVLPTPFYATFVGEKTAYTASALSSPNQCNPGGQRLNPWFYGWNWSVEDELVATTTAFSTKGNPQAFCTQACLPGGSDGLRGSDSYLCGNSVLDPGEDCDIARVGERPGISCTLSCLRPGNKNTANTTTPFVERLCGNGLTESHVGEECDPGLAEMKDYCTADCQWKGSGATFDSAVGNLQCGNGFIGLNNGGNLGEECDIGISLFKATTNGHPNWSGVGCSDQCLHTGTPMDRSYCEGLGSDQSEIKNSPACLGSHSVCGNNILEPGEECDFDNGSLNVLYIYAPDDEGHDVSTRIVVASTTAVCSDLCLLKTACDEEDANTDPDILPNRDANFRADSTRISSNYKCDVETPGCSDSCTRMGSALLYETPSLCGDGVSGYGENPICETSIQAAAIGQDPIQIVEALGGGIVDLTTLSQHTTVTAEALKVQKTATILEDIAPPIAGSGFYGLQCGYVEYVSPVVDDDDIIHYNNCPNSDFGVASNSCCVPRPHAMLSYPLHGDGIVTNTEEKVCRNTYIEASFDTILDPAFVNGMVSIAHTLPDGVVACEDGETDVTLETTALLARADLPDHAGPFFARVWDQIKQFFVAMFESVVHAVGVPDINVDDAVNTAVDGKIWCSGKIIPSVSAITKQGEGESGAYTALGIKVNHMLATNTFYAVILTGGNQGLRSLEGVGIQGKALMSDPSKFNKDDIFIFQTGDDICRIKEVTVTPANHFYARPQEGFDYHADAISTNDQRITSIPGSGYAWNWDWMPRSNTLYEFTIPATTENITVTSTELEGHAIASAQATVTEDITPQSNQINNIFSGISELTSMFCQNPWPSRTTYPYEDGVTLGGAAQNNDGYDPDAATTNKFTGRLAIPRTLIRGTSEYFNFSMGYCADSGEGSTSADDLPFLRPVIYTQGLPVGTLKKFLFFNDKNDDLIGVQVFDNPDRLSVSEWYSAQHLGGIEAYSPISIDGYKGLTDGNNYYINALNELSNRSVENYIYLFGINNNAQENTREVFGKLITSLLFNINIPERNNCVQGNPGNQPLNRVLPLNLGNMPISDTTCLSDLDCRSSGGLPKAGTTGVCANAKTKFNNDWTRLNAIQAIQSQLEGYRVAHGEYPQLPAGTYIPHYTNRHWPSWNKLTEQIGGTPVIPGEDWSACGICDGLVANSPVGCSSNEDCVTAGAGTVCTLPDDMRTCWRSADASFACPAVSNVLEYKATAQNNYQLYLPLEYFNNAAIPRQGDIIREFVSTTHYSQDSYCGVDGIQLVAPAGGDCGNGILNAGEDCDPPGSSSACSGAGCPVCVNDAVTGYREIAYRTCNNTCHYDAAVCRPSASCGNSRVDRGETCDDGVANGTYGHCNATCNGISAAYCGNAVRDWNDIDKDGAKDDNEGYIELCDKNERRDYQGNSELKFGIYGYCAKERGQRCSLYNADEADRCDRREGNAELNYGPCVSLLDPTYDIFEKSPVEEQNSCSSDCQSFGGFCGDGTLQLPDEECDDNNKTSLDGCSAYCQKENVACANILRKTQGAIVEDSTSPGHHDTLLLINYNEETPEECQNSNGSAICLGLGLNCESGQRRQDDGTGYQALSGPNTCLTLVTKNLNREARFHCDKYPPAPLPGPSAPGQAAEGQCGNSIEDAGEECDLGDQNGIRCTPDYGASCTYCSADCLTELTVDPDRMCGNGQIDIVNNDKNNPVLEACDIDPQTQRVYTARQPQLSGVLNNRANYSDISALNQALRSPNVRGFRECTAANTRFAVGTVACTNNCQVLDTSNCAECGEYTDPNTAKAIPKIAVLNVLTPFAPDAAADQNLSWGIQQSGGGYNSEGTPIAAAFPQFDRALYLNPKLAPAQWSNALICKTNGWKVGSRNVQYDCPNGIDADLHADTAVGRACRSTYRRYVNPADQSNYMAFQWLCTGTSSPLDRTYGYQLITNPNVTNEDRWVWGNYTEDLSMIESNAMCNGNSGYSVYFGGNGIRKKNIAAFLDSDNKHQFYSDYGDFFPYPVNNEARDIRNEYVVSPAVPPGTFRVVVRWKNNESNIKFTGLVYNSDFQALDQNDDTEARKASTVNYLTAVRNGNVCSKMSQYSFGLWGLGGDPIKYWLPEKDDPEAALLGNIGKCHGELSSDTGLGVYVSSIGSLEKTSAMALTIPTEPNFSLWGSLDARSYSEPYAFFVQAIAPSGNQTNISALDDLDVTVDVYTYHEGQVPEYSMYLPSSTYYMRESTKSSNESLVKYWHVFNLVNVNGEYRIQAPQNVETERVYEKGVLSTDFVDVLCHVPGELCRRDE